MKTEIIEAIKSFYEINGKLPIKTDFVYTKTNYNQVRKYFGTWNNAIIAAGFEPKYVHKSNWSKEEILSSIQSFYKENSRVPQLREFKNSNLKYPASATVQRHFGSWNKAIEAAGFEANYNEGLGIKTVGKDGVLYRSQAEAYFVDTYLYGKYNYEYELPYGNGWLYDFYIKELDLYVELTYGLKPELIKEKIEFNKVNNINCRVINSDELYSKNFMLP